MTDPYRSPCTIWSSLKVVSAHTCQSNSGGPSFPVFLWLCKNRTFKFFATMKFTLRLAVALFPAIFVNAQYTRSTLRPVATPTPPAPSTTPIPPGDSHINVQVATGGQLVYTPSNFTAKNGTIVTFNFPNSSIPHSVTQGYFGQPCAYLTASGGNPAGFDSGLLSAKQYSLKITNDKEPIFFFCKNDAHCGLGMVGAINAPTAGNTYAAYLAGAKALSTSEPVISNTGAMMGGVGATPVPAIA